VTDSEKLDAILAAVSTPVHVPDLVRCEFRCIICNLYLASVDGPTILPILYVAAFARAIQHMAGHAERGYWTQNGLQATWIRR
jgi:hypothetical protein